ncbi:MAG: hypothetical protein ABFD82_11485 [Syntrophaceae bacterium]
MIIKNILRQAQDDIHFRGELSCPVGHHEGMKVTLTLALAHRGRGL